MKLAGKTTSTKKRKQSGISDEKTENPTSKKSQTEEDSSKVKKNNNPGPSNEKKTKNAKVTKIKEKIASVQIINEINQSIFVIPAFHFTSQQLKHLLTHNAQHSSEQQDWGLIEGIAQNLSPGKQQTNKSATEMFDEYDKECDILEKDEMIKFCPQPSVYDSDNEIGGDDSDESDNKSCNHSSNDESDESEDEKRKDEIETKNKKENGRKKSRNKKKEKNKIDEKNENRKDNKLKNRQIHNQILAKLQFWGIFNTFFDIDNLDNLPSSAFQVNYNDTVIPGRYQIRFVYCITE